MVIEMSGVPLPKCRASTHLNNVRYELHRDTVTEEDFHPSLFEAASVLAKNHDSSRIPFFQTSIQKESDYWDAHADCAVKGCQYEKKWPGVSIYSIKKSWLFKSQNSPNIQTLECDNCHNSVATSSDQIKDDYCDLCRQWNQLLSQFKPNVNELLNPNDPIHSIFLLEKRRQGAKKRQLLLHATLLWRSLWKRRLAPRKTHLVCPVLPLRDVAA